MKRRGFGFLTCVLALGCVLLGPARAEIVFDPALYTSMIDASSETTIPPGTKIMLQNWKEYEKFMPVSMRAGFSGQYSWKLGPGPEYNMEIGPKTEYKFPRILIENTEKYAGQAKLRKVASGGRTLEGYVASVPFPSPLGPDIAHQVLYNAWTVLVPPKSRYYTISHSIDRFHNDFIQEVDVLQWRLSHLSDEGYPTNPAFGKGILQANRFFVLKPEQTKYTTQLAQLPDDPEKFQEIYVFLPSLRRSLRLSSAARCSPILGTDWVQDDNGDGLFFQIPNFSVKLLGEKKVLQTYNGDPKGYYVSNNFDRKSWPGWPSPAVGKWEVRDMYVLDISPLPVIGSYCYGHKVAFVDKQTWLASWFDNFDAHGKYWKSQTLFVHPLPLGNGEVFVVRGMNSEAMVDVQNTHGGISLIESQPVFDKDCTGECAEPEVHAFPSGLSRIMK
jgi:hypothetical protein